MSQSERLRLIQEQATKYVARNKCVDSSLQTYIVQAKASSRPTPSIISAVQNQNGCAANVSITGKGANMEYLGILQAAQASAVGAPCINQLAPPFTQQNLSTMYVAPCTDPGKRDYFPPYVSNGPGCTTNKITTPSG